MRELAAPLPVAAVLLMVVNDRVLKPRFHNALTGKLSDIAICFFLPLFVSALLAIVWRSRPRTRLLVSAALAAFVFVGQEIWPAFQSAFLHMLHMVGGPLGLRSFALTTDATDLWALAMVPLAIAYGWRRLKPPSRPETATSLPDTGRPS
jgi:hypothetical protein